MIRQLNEKATTRQKRTKERPGDTKGPLYEDGISFTEIRKGETKGGAVIPQVHSVIWVEEANKIRVENWKRARSQEVTMSPKENVNMDMSLLCPGGTAGQILYQSAHTTSLHEMWDELS